MKRQNCGYTNCGQSKKIRLKLCECALLGKNRKEVQRYVSFVWNELRKQFLVSYGQWAQTNLFNYYVNELRILINRTTKSINTIYIKCVWKKYSHISGMIIALDALPLPFDRYNREPYTFKKFHFLSGRVHQISKL